MASLGPDGVEGAQLTDVDITGEGVDGEVEVDLENPRRPGALWLDFFFFFFF